MIHPTEGKHATKWTRLSCMRFSANAVRLQLHALAYNLANFLRTLATPKGIETWSLTSLRERLIKTGVRLVRHARYAVFQMSVQPVKSRSSRRSLMSRKISALGRLRIIAVAAVATVIATAASAESITLVRPSQAESLKSGGVSMTVYYLARSKPIEVVATFSERKSARPASQLRMSLLDGDEIEFIIPGRPDVSFQFARSGSLIEVRSNPSDTRSPVTN